MTRLNPNPSPEIIFTAAVKEELPAAWLKDIGVPVHRLRALKAGVLRGHNPPRGDVLFIITGVGPAASQAAARWICEIIPPRCVVNLGAAGALHPSFTCGCWISPVEVRDETGAQIAIDARLPFPFPKSMQRPRAGALLSVQRSQATPNQPVSALPSADLVDMEAFAQAAVFAENGIPFHVLKGISDRADANAKRDYGENLAGIRKAIKEILSFLALPGNPISKRTNA